MWSGNDYFCGVRRTIYADGGIDIVILRSEETKYLSMRSDASKYLFMRMPCPNIYLYIWNRFNYAVFGQLNMRSGNDYLAWLENKDSKVGHSRFPL
jgi:hypothetical protein